jgi:hypothetical protein
LLIIRIDKLVKSFSQEGKLNLSFFLILELLSKEFFGLFGNIFDSEELIGKILFKNFNFNFLFSRFLKILSAITYQVVLPLGVK